MTQHRVSLDDKYSANSDRILISGTQAIVRLALVQRRIDRDRGYDTAGYVSGYRGSPLGGIEQAFATAQRFLEAEDIRLQPGVNEDIAATAVMGTQQINLFEKAHKQGVFAIWYGKGPGVDRSGDAFRHANLAGTSPLGGVLALAGDDHVCKSSTTSHQSEFALMDANIPVLNPSDVAEIVDLGLFGLAMSRYSGCWASLKLTADTVDSAASADVRFRPAQFVLPTHYELPPGGLSIRWPDHPHDQERRLYRFKLPAAVAFAKANGINRVALGGPNRRLGIITAGKSYFDVRQALELLSIDDILASQLGISVYKVGMVWPLEPDGVRDFAAGQKELFVVEEKRPLIENQLKDILYSMPADRRPRVVGKRDECGTVLLPVHDDLNPRQIAEVLLDRMSRLQIGADLKERFKLGTAGKRAPDIPNRSAEVQRNPYFCSGCPHNTSTRVPDGSRAMAGIGCHYLALNMHRETATHTQMGGEGANWIGQAPYVPTLHVFQNMGDGTYFHSGLLAIRAAIAAKVNITYKILFNDAVAMTGGQKHDGELDPQRIAKQLQAEGVSRVSVVADDLRKYKHQNPFPPGVTFHSRDDLDHVQRELRGVPGVTALIYDQVCATEKRRRRKRSRHAPDRRLMINELVCEGCGDCSTKSNCLSVAPIETEFGRKRRIDQSSCNTDYSCLKGFCPSFLSVEGAVLRKSRGANPNELSRIPVPEPVRPPLDKPWNVLVAGVGGTGIVTIGAILAMAAHMEEKGTSTLDMTGMAQKGGPVTSHIRFARDPKELNAARIPSRSADLVLACDLVVSTGKEAIDAVESSRTIIIANTEKTMTHHFLRDARFDFDTDDLLQTLRAKAGSENLEAVAATKCSIDLFGDSIASNLFMVGYAYQKGLIPVSSPSILSAIELNGVSVEMNTLSFSMGRLAAHDYSAVRKHIEAGDASLALGHRAHSSSLSEAIDRRIRFLSEYQHAKYAARYLDFVSRVRETEKAVAGSEGGLSEMVARGLFKLMAYKDEYEIARLYSHPSFRAQLSEYFQSYRRISVYLAPPSLAWWRKAGKEPRKHSFGPWIFPIFALLAKLKGLRGTPFDPFGYTKERKTERALVGEYIAMIEEVLDHLQIHNFDLAISIAETALDISGYGHVKERAIENVRRKWGALRVDFLAQKVDSREEMVLNRA